MEKQCGQARMVDSTKCGVRSLGENDQKLIAALHKNGRASHVELSKLLGLHVSTIAKKMQQLETDGLMSIKALPNPYKLNYQAHAVIALEGEHDKIDAICSQLYDSFNVNLMVTTFGQFDIIAFVFFPTWADLLEYISAYVSPIRGIINMETFLVKEIRKRHFGFPVCSEPIKIDDIDLRLIKILTENGRYTAQHLAEELGVSKPTCLKRLSILLNEKVIEVRAIPNQSSSGYAAYAFILLKVMVGKLKEVCAALHYYQDIFMVLNLYNGFDILIGINASKPEKLYRFIKGNILSIDGVVCGSTLIRAEIKKRYYGPFIEDAL